MTTHDESATKDTQKVNESSTFSNNARSIAAISEKKFQQRQMVNRIAKFSNNQSRARISDSLNTNPIGKTGSLSINLEKQLMLAKDPSRQFLDVTFMQDGQMSPPASQKFRNSEMDGQASPPQFSNVLEAQSDFISRDKKLNLVNEPMI